MRKELGKRAVIVCTDAAVTWNVLSTWLPRGLLLTSTQGMKQENWVPRETELKLKCLHKAFLLLKTKYMN